MLSFTFGALTALLASQSARASLAPVLQARALTAIQGTYNTTFVHVVTSKAHAQSVRAKPPTERFHRRVIYADFPCCAVVGSISVPAPPGQQDPLPGTLG